ncbi:hypothetical protein ACN4DI_01760 [Corynebacterium macclintockiae]|uniref:hypothetical protein n=1 Tax=Corynebacterium macclintockiae TaxID=2913501 RepID=UPI003EBF96D0
MTRVQGDLKIITGTAEAVTEVWVRSKVSRPVPGGWLMDTSDHRPVFDGKVDLELLPGACVLVAVSSGLPGETVDLIVPESGTASLEACIRAAESAGDLERDALDELRRDFGAWLDEARASVSAAGESAKAAKADADRAESSADSAGSSASGAKSSADAAKGAADAAGKSASAAASSASAAKADAGKAATSATNAGKSATAAKADADRAEGVVDSVRWDDDKLTVAGKTSPSLRGEKGDKGEPGGVRGVAIEGDGADPEAAGNMALALGWGANAKSAQATAVGIGAQAGGAQATAVGIGAQAGGAQATAVGSNAQAGGDYAAAVGSNAQAGGDYAAAVGIGAQATATLATAVGAGHKVTTPAETHIGVTKDYTDALDTPPSRVVLHGTAETTLEPTKPGHLVGKGYVDSAVAEARALVETRAVVKQVSTPPSSFEPGVLYVIPE